MTRIVLSMRLQASSYLLVYLTVLHGVMALTALTIPVHWLISVTLLALCVANLWFYYHQYYLPTGRHKLIKVERDSAGLWHLRYGKGDQHTSLRLHRCVVIPELVILYFYSQGFWRRSPTAWITAECVDDELFRQLRVVCRDPKTFQQ